MKSRLCIFFLRKNSITTRHLDLDIVLMDHQVDERRINARLGNWCMWPQKKNSSVSVLKEGFIQLFLGCPSVIMNKIRLTQQFKNSMTFLSFIWISIEHFDVPWNSESLHHCEYWMTSPGRNVPLIQYPGWDQLQPHATLKQMGRNYKEMMMLVQTQDLLTHLTGSVVPQE